MADTTITSANAVLTFIVPGLFPAPVQVQGFASDRAFITDALDLAEVQMGVDGRMTAGYVFNPTVMTITLQADSPSKGFFNTVVQTMKTAREVLYANATLILPSTGEAFTMTRGIITTATPIAGAQKVLQPQDYKVTWERVDPALL